MGAQLTLDMLSDDGTLAAIVFRPAVSDNGPGNAVGDGTHDGAETARLRRLLRGCVRALLDAGVARDEAVHAFSVPGRIEVLGKHTDYAGGRSLLAATERGFVVVVAERTDRRVRIVDALSGETVELDGIVIPATPLWARYPAAVLHRLDRNFPDVSGGADIGLASDLPSAAGLSSSSALVVAVHLAINAVRRIDETAAYRRYIGSVDRLAGYLGAVENGLAYGALEGEIGVGTMGGSEDHTAILAARRDRLVQYGFAPVVFEADVPVPPSHVFVVAASGVRAEKAGAALERYNNLAKQAHRLTELWRTATGRADATLAAAIRSGPEAPSRLRLIVKEHTDAAEREPLLARLAQFVAESEELVPGAADALQRRDLTAFARHVERSQELAERALGNQVPETLALTHTARQLGATAASTFGAGFGGSVWALVTAGEGPAFAAAWREGYAARFPEHQAVCTFFITRAGPPACRLVLPPPRATGA